MINRTAITQWNKIVPWNDNAQVEQDLIMPDKLYDYADHIKLRLAINLYCSRQRTIMYSVEVHNGLYDTKRGRRKMGRDTS